MKRRTMRTQWEVRHDNSLEVASNDFAYLSGSCTLDHPLLISPTFSPRRAAATASSGANPASTAAPPGLPLSVAHLYHIDFADYPA
jgi:hypothetical protein